ncbi:disintegrin and metalloproteinase domain-containing protein 10-like isoform 2-T2 [Anomaloglossus baeobatrachus]|uniref:disintegrin and metalloproteinase domain-containing protein 10-like isoform X2 n=1 Tax=Anomaloglossus baeobatrachus TaxID=238106 RepID=UPI003F4F8F18
MLSIRYAVQFLIALSFFLLGNNGDIIRPFLKYYETISYNRDELFKDHLRLKRDTNQQLIPIQLQIFGYNRKYELILRRDKSVFTDDFKVLSDDTYIPMDISFVYSGKLKDEKDSFCHGSVINGYFHGFIQTKNGTFYLEYEQHKNGTVESYMYHERDIDYSLMKDVKSFDLALKKYEFLETMKWKTMEKSVLRTKRSVDPTRTTCLIHLKADYLFFKRFGNLQEAIAQIDGYIRSVNLVYDEVNFNGIKHINFKVKVLNIIQEAQPKNPIHSAFIGAEKLLRLHSKDNWNNVCLSYLLTNRDYNGLLGLAWIGNEGNGGGICSKFSKFKDAPDKEESRNTGLVTIQKYGQYLPPRLIHITLAHEFGHSMGSPHDHIDKCANFTISSPSGNYLMFPYAMDGNQYNNDKFSACSIHYIASLLKVKKDKCFVESGRPTCGNQIVEDGEQCDVGLKENDMCCYGINAGESLQCTLKPGKQCSPSQGQCCNSSCSYKPKGELCRKEAECTFQSFCTGQTSLCPISTPKSNYTLCNIGTRICLNGMCRQSVCMKYGLEQCDCDTQSLYRKCHLCCQRPGDVSSCRSTRSFELRHLFNMTLIFLPAGSPCEKRQGYCDKFNVCRLVDADGPIARLKNTFLNLIEFDPAAWIKTRWWAVLLIILTLGAMMTGTIFIFGRTLDSKQAQKTRKSTGRAHLGRSNTHNRGTIFQQKEELYMSSIYLQSETRL